MAVLYLTNVATASPYPTTSQKLNETPAASEITLGCGEFDSGFPGNTDAGQWNPSGAVADTITSVEIDNAAGASPTTNRQGWLWDQSLTGRKVKAGAWSFQLRLRANQGTGTLSRICARVSIVTAAGGVWTTVKKNFTTRITGETSHTAGQDGWRDNDARITVTSTAANFAFTIGDAANALEHTFASGERVLVELGFHDADNTTDRTWRLDYNTSNSFITTPTIVDPIAGSFAGTSTPTGTIKGRGALAGATTGVAAFTGTLKGRAPVVAVAFTSVGTFTATIKGRTAMAGAFVGVATPTGHLTAHGRLVGVAFTGGTTNTGTLGADGALAGAFSGPATFTGHLVADGALAGPFVALATLTGAMIGHAPVGGAFTAGSTFTGTLGARGALGGGFVGVNVSTGALGGLGALAGPFAGLSTGAGELTADGALAGPFAGIAAFTGTMRATGDLAGAFVGLSSETGTIRGLIPIAGAFVGLAAFVGDLTSPLPPGQISGAFAGTSSGAGTLIGRTPIAGAFSDGSSFTGTIRGRTPIAGAFAGSTTLADATLLATIQEGATGLVVQIDYLPSMIVTTEIPMDIVEGSTCTLIFRFNALAVADLPATRYVPIDPDHISVTVTSPSGEETVYTLLDGDFVRVREGTFYLLVPCTEPSLSPVDWTYDCQADGFGETEKSGSFYVAPAEAA